MKIALLCCLYLVVATASLDVVSLQASIELVSSEKSRLGAVVRLYNPLDVMVLLPSRWGTPFDDLSPGLSFVVTRGETVLEYEGIVARRLPANVTAGLAFSREGLAFAPHETRTHIVDLASVFDVSEAAEYHVQLLPFTVQASVGSRTEDVVGLNIMISGAEASVVIVSSGPKREKHAGHESHLLGHTFSGCSAAQQTSINNAFYNFGVLMTRSVAGLKTAQNSTIYKTWFGTYLASRFTTVNNCITKLKTNSASGNYLFTCGAAGSTCSAGTIAYVYPATSSTIYLCPTFFTLPATGATSQADTMPHEISHFNVMCSTNDYSYGQTACKNLAVSNPANAVRNADNYAFFSIFV